MNCELLAHVTQQSRREGKRDRAWSQSQLTWVQILSLPLCSWEALGKLLTALCLYFPTYKMQRMFLFLLFLFRGCGEIMNVAISRCTRHLIEGISIIASISSSLSSSCGLGRLLLALIGLSLNSENGLGLLILLSSPPKFWDYRYVPLLET